MPTPQGDVALLPATELLAGFAAKDLSPIDAVSVALDRIEVVNPILNAFRVFDGDRAIEQARDAEDRWAKGEPCGLLDGVPVTIKDLTPTIDFTTQFGSLVTEPDHIPKQEAPIAKRFREHGAIVLGKTTTPEFGWTGVTESRLTGISRNPWDPTKTCGGSSGGAGIAAATGMGALHQGGDGAGSIRIPASFCGVYGIKPTYGVVPRFPYGVNAIPEITHHGPLTRTVRDAALYLKIATQRDARDWHWVPSHSSGFDIGSANDLTGLRIAYSANLGYARVDPEIAAIVERALPVFENLGAIVEAADPGFGDPREIFEALYATLFAEIVRSVDPDGRKRDLFDPGLIAIAEPGLNTTAHQLFDIWQERERMCMAMTEFHQTYDILLTPQLPIAAFETGASWPRHMTALFDWVPFTIPFNFTQQPAASIPCGFTSDGLPVGLQIVAPRFADQLVLRASAAFESVRPIALPELTHVTSGANVQ